MQPSDLVTDTFRLQKQQKSALEKLRINTLEDLLFHFPSRYEDVSQARSIKDVTPNEQVTVYGELSNIEKKLSWRTKKYVIEGTLSDATGGITIRWFNQPYALSQFEHAHFLKVTGKPTGSGKLYFANPTVVSLPSLPDAADPEGVGTVIPIYPESKGITSRWFYHKLQQLLENGVHEKIEDVVPEKIREAYKLPSLTSALVWVHSPEKMKDAQAARKRFAFEEVFMIQVAHQQTRARLALSEVPAIDLKPEKVEQFVNSLPYKLTSAQKTSVTEVIDDLQKEHPMSRLLEGDVGSGKTAVAAASVYGVVTSAPHSQPQTAYMVPTEILAKQQFESFIEFFEHLPIQIGLITGSGCKKFPSKVDPTGSTDISRAQLLKWVKDGSVQVLVGTHSLIQKTVVFKNLAYVIIDEQHRFGTRQRQKLARKDELTPHLLSMTATPIPRTLALTIYGDLDLSVLDEKPPGRKEIKTMVVSPSKRNEVYVAVRSELKSGRQAYVICPRIEEPDPNKLLALRVKSVKAESARLQKEEFKDYRVGLLHGKQTPSEKDEVMREFEEGRIDVLVATSVVEVGVNVPNATMIIIEGAERFGLSQLHQLRGRVQRSDHQPYCYLFSDTKTKTSLDRIKVLEKSSDGFKLAEEDLNIRGAGELTGTSQWGVSDLGMEAIRNIKMVSAARKEAAALVKKDPELKKHVGLSKRVSARFENLHME